MSDTDGPALPVASDLAAFHRARGVPADAAAAPEHREEGPFSIGEGAAPTMALRWAVTFFAARTM